MQQTNPPLSPITGAATPAAPGGGALRTPESGPHAASARTLLALLDDLGSGAGSAVFADLDVTADMARLPYQANAVAADLGAAGVGPGAVVGLLAGTTPAFLPAFFGTLVAGAAASVLPVPVTAAGSQTAMARLVRIVEVAGIGCVLTDPDFAPIAARLRDAVPGLVVVPVDGRRAVARAPGPGPAPDDIAVVQFTSGSTSTPKGVLLSHRAVLAGLDGVAYANGFDADEVHVSWNRLFHDMGLFGLLAILACGGRVHLFSPTSFIRRPARILDCIAEQGGTCHSGPDFGYALLGDVLARGGFRGSLASWRTAVNGAEPVRAATLASFEERARAFGAGEDLMRPCYGLAEVTLQATGVPGSHGNRVLWVDRRRLASDAAVVPADPADPAARAVVSVGLPVPGMAVRVMGGDEAVEPGRAGEIELRGPSVTRGYLNDSAATSRLFHDGWLRTGDQGFRKDGELFVTGRTRDMIIVRGQNFHAEDVEELVRDLPGVHRRRCVAVSDTESENILLAAESRDPARAGELTESIRSRVAEALGLAALRVVPVRPGSLPTTTSGKWRRDEVRRVLLADRG